MFVCIVVYESEVIIQIVTDSVRLTGCTSWDCVNFVNWVKCVRFILYGSTVKVLKDMLCVCTNLADGNHLQRIVRGAGFRTGCEYRSASVWPNLAARMFFFCFVSVCWVTQNICLIVVFLQSATITVFCMLIPCHKSPVVMGLGGPNSRWEN